MDLVAHRLVEHILFGEAEDPKSFLKRMSLQKDAEDYKTGRKQKPEAVEPCQEWIEWEDLEEWQQAAALELEAELECQFALKSFDAAEFIVATRNHDWYRVFRDEDAAQQAAIEYVRDGINEEPDNWNHNNYLNQFINLDRLKQMLHSDARDDDYWNEEHPDIESKIEELIDRGYLDEDPLIDSDENAVAVTPEIERMVDDKWEEFIDAYATEQVDDPIEYLKNFGTEAEAYKRAIELVGIDVDRAAANAVQLDGWAHFLNSYDGNSNDLPGGAVYVRQ